MTRRLCVISTGGSDNILHVYGPESQRETCSMIKGWSSDVCVEGASGEIPDLTLLSAVDGILSVNMLFVPLIHINAISSTVNKTRARNAKLLAGRLKPYVYMHVGTEKDTIINGLITIFDCFKN